MDIVTGHVGSAHVTSWQDRDLNQGIFGPDTYILNVGSKLAATIISNNEIRIADGTLVMQGCQGVIQKGTYDTISIDNGTQGLKRNDLICAQYTKSAGVESMSLVVIKGTAASTPSDPSYTSGDIQNGDTPVQVPVYRVVLDGLTLEAVEAQVPTRDSITDVASDVWDLQNTVGYLYTNEQTSISMTNNSYVDCVSVNVLAGTYIVDAGIDFGSNTSGNMRDLWIVQTEGNVLGYFKQSPSTGTRPNVTRGCAVVVMASDGTIKVQGIQNSGSTITADRATISALRIK